MSKRRCLRNRPLYISVMALSRIVLQAIDCKAADLVHAEITKFVNVRNPGIVEKQHDKALSLDHHLKSTDLEKTSVLVLDFLAVRIAQLIIINIYLTYLFKIQAGDLLLISSKLTMPNSKGHSLYYTMPEKAKK
jgi:hypothetical protein